MFKKTNLLLLLLISASLGTWAQTSDQLVQTHFSGMVVSYPQKGNYFKQFAPGISIGGSVHLSKWLNANITAGVAPSVKLPNDLTPGGSMWVDFHTGLQFKFNNGTIFKEDARFAPYLYAGVGYNIIEDKKGAYAPLGLGLKIKMNDNLSLNLESIYRQSFSSSSLQPMSHSIGLAYTIVHSKVNGISSINKANSMNMDDDKDGIPNKLDNCPFDFGSKVNGGCPDMIGKVNPNDVKEPAKVDEASGLDLDDLDQLASIQKAIIFKPNTDELLQSSKGAIDQLASVMKKYPNHRLIIEAHTDNASGDVNFSKNITIKQSYKVKSYLAIEKGISPTRITNNGYGDSRPLISNNSESARRANRRVELRMVRA